MEEFKEEDLRRLLKPAVNSSKEDNGKVTVIGGSSLFHGAPILALKTASRIVDMVFFSSPEPSVGKVAERIKSRLGAFIWVPFDEIGEYIQKSDAVLIGPGLMRYHKKIPNSKFPASPAGGQIPNKFQIIKSQILNKLDRVGQQTKKITETLLQQFPQKQWVIDAGSLQVMEAKYIPPGAILTPNKREFQMLFGTKAVCYDNTYHHSEEKLGEMIREKARKYNCVVVLKGVKTFVCSPEKCVVVTGGNAGLTKGGTGDVLAGLTVGLAAKNEPFLAACAASFILKKAAEEK